MTKFRTETRRRVKERLLLLMVKMMMTQWCRSQVKSGGLNIVPSPVVGLGFAPRKKINFALKIMQFWASFGTSFLYYSIKWGLSPVLKVGDLSPSPCSPAPTHMWWRRYWRPIMMCRVVVIIAAGQKNTEDLVFVMRRYSAESGTGDDISPRVSLD